MKLENRTVYPRYYHILPTADGLNRARAHLLKLLKWKKSIILVQAGDLFTLNAKDLRDQMMSDEDLDLPDLQVLPESNNYDEIAQYVKASNIRVIFGLFYEERARQVICSFYKYNIRAPAYVWIFVGWYHSPTWYISRNEAVNCSKAQMKEALDGHFTLDFTQLGSNLSAPILLTGKTVGDVTWEFRKLKNITNNTPVSETFKQYSAYGYDAILAIARMLDIAVHKFGAKGEIHWINNFTYEDYNVADVFNAILENDSFPFEGLTGRVALYNLLTTDGKRKYGDVQINYIQTNDLDAHESDGHQVTNVGLFQNQNGEVANGVGIDKIPWTSQDMKVPVDSPRIVVKLEGKGAFITIAFIDSVCIGLTLVLLFFNIAHRNHSVIRRSFLHLNELILFGSLLMYMVVIVYGFNGQFFYFNNSSLALCYVRDLLLSFGSTFIFGSLLVKTTTKLLKQSVGVKISVDSLLIINGSLTIGFMLLIDSALFSMWYGFDPWKKGTQQLSSSNSQTYLREKCTSDEKHHHLWWTGVFSYKLLVMIICGVAVCIRVKASGRRKEHGTSDSPYLDVAAVGCSFGFAIAAFGFTFVENTSLEYVLVSLSLITMTSIVLVLLFYRKICWIRKSREETEEICEEILDPMRDMAVAELKDLRKRSRDLRVALEKVMEESSEISAVLKDEVCCILKNRDAIDAE